jgi:sugar lactone lactonase YvrE
MLTTLEDVGATPRLVTSGTPDVLGENPVWSARDHALYWVDIRSGRCRRLNVDSFQVVDIEFAGLTPGVAITEAGHVLVAERSSLTLVASNGHREMVIDLKLHPSLRINELKTDPAGRPWLGFMDDKKRHGRGGLVRCDPAGPSVVVKDITVPNGMCWSPDGSIMYFADSAAGRVWACDYAPGSGRLSRRREFVRIPVSAGVPDGAAVDSAGHIWIAHYGGGCVVRYTPGGVIEEVVRLPVSQPTSCAFGGSALDILFVTSARQGLDAAQLEAESHAGRLFAFRPQTSGLTEPTAHVQFGQDCRAGYERPTTSVLTKGTPPPVDWADS